MLSDMAIDRLRQAIAQDESLDDVARTLSDAFSVADLNALVSALADGDERDIAEALHLDLETLERLFQDLQERAAFYEAEFPEFREYRRGPLR